MKYVYYVYKGNYETLREIKGLIHAGIYQVHCFDDSV